MSVVCFVCRNASHLFLGYWRYCCSYIVTSSYTCCIRSAISSHTIHNMILSRLSVCGFIFGVHLWNNILWRSLQPALGRCFEDLFATYLDMPLKLQFDTNDSALCGSNNTLRNILELIWNEPVEFHLRLDHSLNGDVREWLTGSDNIL